MTYIFESDLNQYSTVLEENLNGVAEDLRTIDLADLVSYIRFGSYATIEDLLHSSSELFFQHGALNFAWTAGVDMPWGELPTVTMGMEFRLRAVSVFFDLSLRAFDQTVKVCGILFEEPVRNPQEKISRLSDAIAEVRLPEQPERRPRLPRLLDGSSR